MKLRAPKVPRSRVPHQTGGVAALSSKPFGPAMRSLGISLCAVLLRISCDAVETGPPPSVQVDVRPPSTGFPKEWRLTLASDQGAESSEVRDGSARLTPRLSRAAFALYPASRVYVLVETGPSKSGPSTVWNLPKLRRDASGTWTAWLAPDFIDASGNTWWNLVYGRIAQLKQSRAPTDSFRARFRYVPIPWPEWYRKEIAQERAQRDAQVPR